MSTERLSSSVNLPSHQSASPEVTNVLPSSEEVPALHSPQRTVLHSFTPKKVPLAWVLSDKTGLRQLVLQARGFNTINFHHDLHSKRQLESMLASLQHQRPAVFWVHLAGPAAGSGNRVDSRRTENLVRLSRAQMAAGRCLVLEANSRSGAWHMNAVTELCQTLHSSCHAWCRHERLNSDVSFPCSAELRLCTNFEMPEMSECHCPAGTKHVGSKSLGADLRIRSVLQSLVDIALREGYVATDVTPKSDGLLHGQPESPIMYKEVSNYIPSPRTVSAPESGPETEAGLELRFDALGVLRDRGAIDEVCQRSLECQDFTFQTCLGILSQLPLGSQRATRQAQATSSPLQGCVVFGVYSYGAFSGITRQTTALPPLVRYVNAFLKFHGAKHPWSSFSINRNTVLNPHIDPNNLPESVNQTISFGEFTGGELWVALPESDDVPDNAILRTRLLPTGKQISGQVVSTRHRLVAFSPKSYHATMPWQGVRWSVTAYLNRGILHLRQKHWGFLRDHGFNLPVGHSFMQSSCAIDSPEDLAIPIQVQSAITANSFPTTQAMNRKAKLKAGHVVKPKLKIVEQWHDDMGEDLSSLESVLAGVAWNPVLLGSHRELPDVSFHAQNEDFIYTYLCAAERWLHGSGVLSPSGQVMQPSAFLAFVTARTSWASALHVCELFGGEGRTSFLAAKLHDLTSGVKFDIVCGFDLLCVEHVQLLWHYLHVMRPLMVVMAPPCTAFCRLQGLNRIVNHAAWQAAQAIGLPLARLCAQVATFQLSAGRHFLLEQPRGSLLFQLPEYQALAQSFDLIKVVFDQCMTGLRMMTFPFLPIRKRTQFWASAPIILARLSAYHCPGKHQHATVSTVGYQHSSSPHVTSRASQVWPYKLCQLVAAAIADLVCSTMERHYFVVSCPGCRGHFRMDDPKHTRSGDCKYPNVQYFRQHMPLGNSENDARRRKPRSRRTPSKRSTCSRRARSNRRFAFG